MKCCPYLYATRILSRKWSYPLLRTVSDGLNFAAIKRQLHYITSKTLTAELRLLQEEGLVRKSDDLYILTEIGWSFLNAMRPLAQWSTVHADCRTCEGGKQCGSCEVYKLALEGKCADVSCGCITVGKMKAK